MPKYHLWFHGSVAAILLTGVTLDRHMFHLDPRNADDYHARVRAAAEAMPVHVGNWVSKDIPVLAGAVALLRPNVVMERSYRNIKTDQVASFLLVQCRDARDLVGHYPPVCYPAHGFVLVKAEADTRLIAAHKDRESNVDWEAMTINGRSYEFSGEKRASKGPVNVYDFMVLPNGKIAPDMDGVYTIARDRSQRYFGAAQIQIATDSAMSKDDRQEIIQTLLNCAQPVIQAIRTGVTQ